MSKTRKEVEAHLAGLFDEARASGLSDAQAFARIRAQYPTVPELVLTMAAVESEANAIDAWWRTLEKTIDGEVIKNALAHQGAAP